MARNQSAGPDPTAVHRHHRERETSSHGRRLAQLDTPGQAENEKRTRRQRMCKQRTRKQRTCKPRTRKPGPSFCFCCEGTTVLIGALHLSGAKRGPSIIHAAETANPQPQLPNRNARSRADRSQPPAHEAEREGFEPSVRGNAHTLSRRAPSTTRTPLQQRIARHQPLG